MATSDSHASSSASIRSAVNDVWLHIYDLNAVTARFNKLGLKEAHLGAFHCGVEVLGNEWFASWSDSGDSGVVSHTPKQHNVHIYRESLYMGESPLCEEEIQSTISNLKHRWPGYLYHPVQRNCVVFAEELLEALCIPKRVPIWVKGATVAGSSAALLPLADFAWDRIKQRAHKAEVKKQRASQESHVVRERPWHWSMQKAKHLASTLQSQAEPKTGKDGWSHRLSAIKAMAKDGSQWGSSIVSQATTKARTSASALSSSMTSVSANISTSSTQACHAKRGQPVPGISGVLDVPFPVDSSTIAPPRDVLEMQGAHHVDTVSSNVHEDHSRYWHVSLDRTAGDQLGIDVDICSRMEVETVKEGLLVDAWNHKMPSLAILPGDHICEVNGETDLIKMLAECQILQPLRLLVARASTDLHSTHNQSTYLGDDAVNRADDTVNLGDDAVTLVSAVATNSAPLSEDSSECSSSVCSTLPSPRTTEPAARFPISLNLEGLTPRLVGSEKDVQTIPMSARDAVRESLSLPQSNSWEWPLSRCEKKARVEALERNLWLMDHSELIRENASLREQRETSEKHPKSARGPRNE